VTPYYADDLVTLHLGDCLEVLATLPGASVDAVVTDPPYNLGFMGKKWDSPGKAFVERKADRRNAWDHVGGNHNPVNSADQARTQRIEGQRFQAWCEAWAAECLRVLKPGGHLLAFGGTRTYHRLACGIEDAGFEVRDSLHWLYGSGFPKSLDAGKAIDKAAGAVREVTGKGQWAGRESSADLGVMNDDAWKGGTPRVQTAPATEGAARWDGWGTALKPGHEPVILARKPLAGTVAGNVLEHGTGALNIGRCRVGTGEASTQGRWPPNVLLTHSAACEPAGDCPVAELDRQSGPRKSAYPHRPDLAESYAGTECPDGDRSVYSPGLGKASLSYTDAGGASRFFPAFRYEAKAPRSERPRLEDGTAHPTVKPLALMRWLVRLVTPPGGVVLDPFAGSGTTLQAEEACPQEGLAAPDGWGAHPT